MNGFLLAGISNTPSGPPDEPACEIEGGSLAKYPHLPQDEIGSLEKMSGSLQRNQVASSASCAARTGDSQLTKEPIFLYINPYKEIFMETEWYQRVEAVQQQLKQLRDSL